MRTTVVVTGAVCLLVVVACGEPMPTPGLDAPMGPVCTADFECADDGIFCNGAATCDPESAAADARGCVASTGSPCGALACDETTDACVEPECDADGDGEDSDSAACGGTDCDDDDPERYRANTEVCDDDDLDEDCDPLTFGERDRDGDLALDRECCNGDTCGTDCDDTRPGVHRSAPEVCDTADNDCDGSIDEGVVLTCYVDVDRDRYAASGAGSTPACDCPVGTTPMPPDGDDVDCNDALADVSPGSAEICSNTRDDDCDDVVDEAGNDWYRDCDGDGYGTGTPVRQCASPGVPGGCPGGGHVLIGGDCNDASTAVRPSSVASPVLDLCDAIDNDCDGTTADGASEAWLGMPCDGADADLCGEGMLTCGAGGVDMVCTDAAEDDLERCGGVDEDCDGTVDEAAAAAAECDARMLPNTAAAVCTAGVCGVATCAAGYNDCVAAGPGCESACGWRGCSMGGCDDVVDVGTSPSRGPMTCAVRESGATFCWGTQPSSAATVRSTTPVIATGIIGAAVEAEGGWIRTAEGRVFRPLASTTFGAFVEYVGVGVVTDLGVNSYRSTGCVVRSDGRVVCDESGEMGANGNGTTTRPASGFAVVTGLNDAVEVGAGQFFACARRVGGTVVCWGTNDSGQLGDGVATHSTCTSPWTGDCSLTPVTVSGITNAVELSVGSSSACARLATGEVRCWGFGVGLRGATTCPGAYASPTPCSRVPVTVAGLTASRLFEGFTYAPYAVTTAGALVVIQNNNTFTDVGGPADPIAGEGVFPSGHACVVDDGVPYCRGGNDGGQLGDGTLVTRTTWAPVLSPP